MPKMFSRFDTTPACDRQTIRQTDRAQNRQTLIQLKRFHTRKIDTQYNYD